MFNHAGKTIVLCLLAMCVFTEGRILAQATLAPGSPAVLQGPSFVPDSTFQGSTLAGWHALGPAEWTAENGELVGKGVAGPGWLVLNRSYQDTGFYAGF